MDVPPTIWSWNLAKGENTPHHKGVVEKAHKKHMSTHSLHPVRVPFMPTQSMDHLYLIHFLGIGFKSHRWKEGFSDFPGKLRGFRRMRPISRYKNTIDWLCRSHTSRSAGRHVNMGPLRSHRFTRSMTLAPRRAVQGLSQLRMQKNTIQADSC